MNTAIRLSLTPDQVCALNNALRREIDVQRRLLPDANRVGVEEYIRHLESALGCVSSAWDRTVGSPVTP